MDRVLEPEVMDCAADARDYDSMDHSHVNLAFATDFLKFHSESGIILDVGTGTARIPIQICQLSPSAHVIAIDLAEEMLSLARANVATARLTDRIRIQLGDAKRFPFPDHSFTAIISNSIIHHIPKPLNCFTEIVRVCRPLGGIFVRDLLRPEDRKGLEFLVEKYAKGENDHQRQLFAASLAAALTLEEVANLVESLGYPRDSVQQTSDRHWTWATTKSTS